MSNITLVLASSSPYRRKQLEALRLSFERVSPNVDESALNGEHSRALALRLAEMKARSVMDPYSNALIIGSDQTAEMEGTSVGKPESHENAAKQLRGARNKAITFFSAIALLNTKTGSLETDVVETIVNFANPSDEEIERYLRIEKPYDCTGSAKIEGLGIVLVRSIVGPDPTALIGLPLITLVKLLKKNGVDII